MAVKKIRVDGRTIRSDGTYTGNQVMHLLEVSFENGYRRGKTENKQLTTPTERTGEWIRCEDRLPEDGATVFFQVYEEEWADTDGYVIDENTHVELGEFRRYRNDRYAFKYTDAISECIISNHNPHEKVVAWQPVVIPEPYKGGDTE